MKTRQLSDAAIVASLLLTSLADPAGTDRPTDEDKNPALRKPSTYIPLIGAPYAPGAAPAGRV